MSSNFINQSKPGRKKTRRDDDTCLVCGDQAIGLNFGVHTCSPCKAFFRRNAVKLGTYEFRCRENGDCPITSNTRRQCNCCRLAKCFRVGMNPQNIRTDEQQLERLRLIEYNRQKRAENNQQIIRPSNLLTFNCLSLSSNDQTLLTNIFSAYEQTCVTLRYHQHINMPNDETLSLQKFMNSCADMYASLIQYYKFIPEFSNLSYSLKKSLIKSNLNQLFRLNSALVIKATGFVDDPNSLVFMRLFPPDLFRELYKCTVGLVPFVYDPIFLKLILIVLMFSTHLSIRYENDYSNINLLNIQNIYVELLWRYILSRCSDYRQVVRLFSLFITRLVYSQDVNLKLNEFVSKITSNQTDQLVPIMKVMWLNDE